MTVQEFQDQLHAQYQGDIDTPAEGEEDWDLRLLLSYDWIDTWEGYEGTTWLELFVWLSDATDGEDTTDGTSTQFDCPTDFKFPGGFVTLISGTQRAKYRVIRPEEIEINRNSGEAVCWFTGNKRVGFKLNFFSAPLSGQTIDYPYYKSAFKPTAAAHIFELSDPSFLIKGVLSKLHELDGQGDSATLSLNLANSKLSMMKAMNQLPIWFQDSAIPDSDFSTGTGGFGI